MDRIVLDFLTTNYIAMPAFADKHAVDYYSHVNKRYTISRFLIIAKYVWPTFNLADICDDIFVYIFILNVMMQFIYNKTL